MRCTLMHKKIPVAKIILDDDTCSISSIEEVYAPAHIPVGIAAENRAALNDWWRGRAIPASRDGIRDALEELSVSSTEQLLDKCFGLSLSDQYWICPEGSGLAWENVNFFDNDFSDDVGNILFGKGSSGGEISLMSPDNTSDGWLKKKWTIIDGKRCLLKGGSGATRQEPYNEVLASAVMRRLGIPHVSYDITMQEEYPYSLCEDFITPDTELISAYYIMQTIKKPNHLSVYQHFLLCCEELGIPGVPDFLDRMITLDYLIVNEDRHLNNFGAIRNAETLSFTGMAPIYDNGTSMWFSSPTSLIRANSPKLPSKPFKTTHAEQIKLVQSFDWLDLSALEGIEEEFYEILKDSVFIEEPRRNVLCRALNTRIKLLSEEVRQHSHFIHNMAISNRQNDIQRDIAYSGETEEDLEI